MRRRNRQSLILLCLLALVWCQTAMAAQWCHGLSSDATELANDCHGAPLDADQADGSACPGTQALPDFGKLPTLAPLLSGHDFPLLVFTTTADAAPTHLTPTSRAGPSLAALCRLLI